MLEQRSSAPKTLPLWQDPPHDCVDNDPNRRKFSHFVQYDGVVGGRSQFRQLAYEGPMLPAGV